MESFEDVQRVGVATEGRIADAIKVWACESRKKKVLYDFLGTTSWLLVDIV